MWWTCWWSGLTFMCTQLSMRTLVGKCTPPFVERVTTLYRFPRFTGLIWSLFQRRRGTCASPSRLGWLPRLSRKPLERIPALRIRLSVKLWSHMPRSTHWPTVLCRMEETLLSLNSLVILTIMWNMQQQFRGIFEDWDMKSNSFTKIDERRCKSWAQLWSKTSKWGVRRAMNQH